jgi:hypothetical protein
MERSNPCALTAPFHIVKMISVSVLGFNPLKLPPAN